MVTEDYVSLNTAKLLKEKGFDERVKSYFTDDGLEGYMFGTGQKSNSELEECFYSRPTLQMVMKWLREVHNLFIQVTIVPHTTVTMEQKYYLFSVHKNRRNLVNRNDHPHDCYSTYEEAAEAAIKYCLEKLI